MAKRAGQGFLPSAELVLRKAGKPLSVAEIVERAIKAGLLVTSGKTPRKTLTALLNRHVNTGGSNAKFEKVGPNTFTLRKR